MNNKPLVIKTAPRQYFLDKEFDDLNENDLTQFKDYNNGNYHQEEKDY